MDSKQMIEKYNLDVICKLINLLESKVVTEDITTYFQMDEKGYIIDKSNKRINLSCIDGRNLEIILCQAKMLNYYLKYYPNIAEIKYSLLASKRANNNRKRYEMLNLTGKSKYATDFATIKANDLVKHMEIEYTTLLDDCVLSSRADLDFNNFFLKGHGQYDFYSNEIRKGAYHISTDGKTLLAIGNETVPFLEEIKKFNIEEERKKIESNTTLHLYTKKVLQESITQLEEVKKHITNIINFYKEEIPICEQLIQIRKDLMENQIEKSIFTKQELESCLVKLKEEIERKNKEQEKEKVYKNSPEGKAKEFVKKN